METKGQKTRKHILQESRRLFTVRGFYNTSISEIINATGVKKGNLYYHFPSKEELGVAVLTDARDEFFSILENSFSGKDPRARVVHSCQVIMELMQQSNFVGGCLFGNTILEMTDTNSRFGRILQEVFSHWKTRIAHELRLVNPTENYKKSLPPEVLATAVVAMLEGGILLARVYEKKRSLEECIAAIDYLLTE